ncbi:MAG: AraC family transcriptional regulator [Lachnospiraceae bacterium]|nr:AraC family transcriptional regulator [Lachnospiraceae bacterium]
MSDLQLNVTIDKNERQLERHGAASFPVAFYHGDLTSNTVVWHWHDELELILIHRGTIAAGAGGASVTLAAGEGCFIKTGVLHSIWKTDNAPCEYRSVVFHPRLVGSMGSIFWLKYIQPLGKPEFPQIIPFAGQASDDYPKLFSRLWQIQETKEIGYENDVRYLLTKLVSQLSNAPVEKEHQSLSRDVRDMERMKTMLSFLEAHYAEELTLRQIAESACISETECMRCFRRSIGMSPIRFLKERRLQYAAGLLRSTGQTVSEIAASCGFWDMSYFTKAFRQLYGATPTAYRRGS